MQVVVGSEQVLKHVTSALIVGCWEEAVPLEPQLSRLNAAMRGGITALYAKPERLGKEGTVSVIPTVGLLAAERIIMVGLGRRSELTSERLRRASGSALQAARRLGLSSCSLALHLMDGLPQDALELLVDGALLGSYRFDVYKASEEEDVSLLTVLCPEAENMDLYVRTIKRTTTISQWVIYARDLVSHPGNVLTPSFMAEQSQELAGRFGLKVSVLEYAELHKLGMGGIVGVGKGSSAPPCFVILEYCGPGAPKKPTVLVGKGVTFDSGGISLKPREGMERMKDDMAGAAAVLATTAAAAELALPVHLVTLIPLAENMPDGKGYKPGDILHLLGEKTVEIVNTDAEGRLLLADALAFSLRYKPAAVIDLATLTGACLVALGTAASGLMGNDRRLLERLRKSGEASGELLWELPVWDAYGDAMKSDVADLKNAGGPHGGAVTAGWFLKQFVGTASWAHIDIAGTAWEEKGTPVCPKGATGVGVRLLIEYLRSK